MSLGVFRFLSPVVLSLIVSGVFACGGGDDDDGNGDGDGISAECQEATQHSDLAWIQENVFNGSCALSPSCHAGDNPVGQGLNLEDGNTEMDTVGIPANGANADGLNIVEPGDPANSYILIALGQFGADDSRIPPSGRMPLNSPPLCQEELDAIARWIESLPAAR